jgi:hypothetical protein
MNTDKAIRLLTAAGSDTRLPGARPAGRAHMVSVIAQRPSERKDSTADPRTWASDAGLLSGEPSHSLTTRLLPDTINWTNISIVVLLP